MKLNLFSDLDKLATLTALIVRRLISSVEYEASGLQGAKLGVS